MSDANGIERRNSERFPTLNFLNFYEMDADNAVQTHGIAKTLDLSETGACISVPREFLNNGHLEFEIALDEEIIKLQASIIDQEQIAPGEWRVRVKFLNIRPMLKHRLFSFFRDIR
jgi:hypothetical protein